MNSRLKPKKCKHCKEQFTPFSSMAKACSPRCAIELVEAQKRKSYNKKTRELKQSIKKHAEWQKEAQDAFNKYIRLRDHFKPCVSCGATNPPIKHGGAWDAGHFRTRGAAGHLRFNTFNVHKQCKSCNGGGGRFSSKAVTVDARYREELASRIGTDRVERLENDNSLRSFDIDYLKRVKAIFNKRWRRLAKKISESN